MEQRRLLTVVVTRRGRIACWRLARFNLLRNYGMDELILNCPDSPAALKTTDYLAVGAAAPVNAMTVDVEDYFQVSAFERHVRPADWERVPQRVERCVDRILQHFSDHDVRGTFFTLGWIAERYPAMVRRIVAEGHELASHGWDHVRAIQQTQLQFREDVSRTKAVLEHLTGSAVVGYRAASYSIGQRNIWALQILDACGYRYSSSIYPIQHDLYGMPEAPRFPFRPCPDSQFIEIPVTTFVLGARKLPCGGGGYFRFFPYVLSRWAIRRVNRCDRQNCIFYFHPWEIDPDQPRQPGLEMKTRFRHYLNLHRMEPRLLSLLRDFHWGRVDRIFLQERSEN